VIGRSLTVTTTPWPSGLAAIAGKADKAASNKNASTGAFMSGELKARSDLAAAEGFEVD